MNTWEANAQLRILSHEGVFGFCGFFPRGFGCTRFECLSGTRASQCWVISDDFAIKHAHSLICMLEFIVDSQL